MVGRLEMDELAPAMADEEDVESREGLKQA
jgi:hypothetical protein